MKQILSMQLAEQRHINWLKWLRLAGVIALVAAAVWAAVTYYPGNLGQRALSPESFEEATGIRVTLIAVTGGGGFIDFRMKVLDVDKATELFANPENIPVLIAEDGKTTLSPAEEVAFDADWQTDLGYYMFYINANGAIKRGSPVTVVIGDYRLEPINAQ